MRLHPAVMLLEPTISMEDSILNLSPTILQERGIKGLILDVDDTLVSSRVANVSPEVIQWMQSIKAVVKVTLVSNNLKRSRIRRIASILEVPYYFGASKPSRRKLRLAAKRMNLPPQQVAMVGDRLFTDVLAGNRLGMLTILVAPMEANPGVRKRICRLRSFELLIAKGLGASI
jgi:uncharacterized protein